MISAKNNITADVTTKINISAEVNNAVIYVEPPLEDLEVTPTMEDQVIESELYGFDKVLVKAIESDSIIVEPSKEDQIFEGLYNRVMINGEPNLVPENIPEGISMFGVDGNKKVVDTTDATATADDIIAPKTAYVNEKKVTGNIICNYTAASLGSATMYNSEYQFNDVDPLKGIATSFDDNNIMIHSINSDYSIVKTFTVPVTWKTTTTKEILSAKIFKGNFDTGYIVYVLTLDIASPCYLITRLVISKDLEELLTISTYTETYTTNINDGMCLDIERKNVAVPSPVDPYIVAYICFKSLGTWNYHWNYGYVSKINFSTNPSTVTRSDRIQHFNTSGNVKNSEGIINLQFDETGKYISCLFTMEERLMNLTSIYYAETMTTGAAVTSVRSKPLFNIDNNIYTISDSKLLLLDGVNHSEVGSISNSILGYRSYYKTFKDNIFLMSYDTKTIMRYSLSSTKTSFLLKQTINNGNNFNVYKTGVIAQNNNYIYDYNVSNSGEISDIEMLGKKFYDTSNVVTTNDKILKDETVFTSVGKVKGTMPNNGTLNYTPTTETQIIPAGYTSGGSISAVDFTTLEDYEICNQLASDILGDVEIPVAGLSLKLIGSMNNGDSYNSSATNWINLVDDSSINISNGSWSDKSLSLNGSNTEFDTGISQTLLKNGYTIVARIKPTAWNNYRGLLGLQYDGGSIGYSNNPDSRVAVTVSTSVLPLNEWHNVACVYDGGYSYVYVDNTLIGKTTTTVTFSPIGNLIFGKSFNQGDRFFKGYMSHAIVYNRYLGQQEIEKVCSYINKTINGGV